MTFIDNLLTLPALHSSDLSAKALQLAQFSLLDWMACGIAGSAEPVSVALRALASAEGGAPDASLFGGGQAPARMAALVNGAASHSLDYDDTHFAHVGHLSVGIYPAALALAEELDASAAEAVEAFLIGAEGAIRTGLVLGSAHYNLGFHQTATAGAFGATLAAGRLLGLGQGAMRHAIGLCATRAAGLKSQFGTMGKPYNAGLAASTGVECAKLAALGMTSADDGLMGPQGFVETHTPSANPQAGWQTPPPETFLFEQNKYKLHACCHGTHAMIEAVLSRPDLTGAGLSGIDKISLRTNPRWLKVCDLKRPRTGLEIKFSYAWLAGMAVRGDETGNDRAYTDDLTRDPALSDFACKVEVLGDADLSDGQAQIHVHLTDGREIASDHDLDVPLPSEVLAQKLRSKAIAMIAEKGEALWSLPDDLGDLGARTLGGIIRSV